MADTPRVKLNTPKARLSFPNLFRAKAAEEGQEPKYSCTLLFSPEAQATPEFAAMKAAAQAVVVAKFGNKIPPNLRNPFRAAEEKADKAGYEPGWVFINISSKERPGVVHVTPAGMQRVLDEGDVYPGCFVIASVSPYAYDQKGNRGVSFGLNNVLKVGDGDPLGGRSRPEDDFAGYAAPPADTAAPGGTASPSSLF
jgi:hypothetical protein